MLLRLEGPYLAVEKLKTYPLFLGCAPGDISQELFAAVPIDFV